jgi:hypothetical protein
MNPTDFSELPLRDIHLPAAVGWWPPAPGWWVLGALVLAAAIAYGAYYYLARHRRVALRALQRVRSALEQGAEPVACLQSVSTVLRRFAMTTVAPDRAGVPTPDVPGLIGEAWLKYLDSRWNRAGFASASGRRLLAAPYARPNSIERTAALELTALCVDWLSSQPVRPRAAIKGA